MCSSDLKRACISFGNETSTCENSLRASSIFSAVPIVCFSLIPDNLAAYVFEYDIVPVISGIKSAKALAATGMGKYGKEAKVMVAVDTGMGRVGFLPDEKALEDIRQISKIEGITITEIFSHFATSDDRDKTYAYEQLKILRRSTNDSHRRIRKQTA